MYRNDRTKGKGRTGVVGVVAVFLMLTTASLAWSRGFWSSQDKDAVSRDSSDAALLNGFRHVEVASVSDALEQLTGKRMYMSHRMRPLFPSKFSGFALTVLLKKETNHDPEALKGM